MSSWTNLRSWLKPQAPRTPRARLRLEGLETRETPTITVVNNPLLPQPAWEAVGPTAIQDPGGVPGAAPQVGSVSMVAVDPNNPNKAVIGATNGGVWTTNNYNAANPVWTTTTDALPSLAISAVAFNPVQQDVIYAGTGSLTTGGLGEFFAAVIIDPATGLPNPGSGGAPVGLYRSTNGGASWSNLGGGTFNGLRITSIVPTRLNGGQTIFVCVSDDEAGPTASNVFRSDNGGATWVRISNIDGLPRNRVTSLVADEANPNRFYAAMVNTNNGTGAGVYMLDLSVGTAWVNITGNLPPAAVTNSPRILLASSGVGANPIYAAVVGPNGGPAGVYRGVRFGNNVIWTAVGPAGLPPHVNPGGQGELHFALTTDPTSDRIIYLGGDQGGRIVRGDALANTWTWITLPQGGGAPGGTSAPLATAPLPTTAPHADIRSITFSGTDTLLVATDGGIYEIDNPRAENNLPPVTRSLNTVSLQISELYRSGMDNLQNTDPTDDVYLHAAQDNGAGDGNFANGFFDVSDGDGTVSLADVQNGYRYFSAQGFAVRRRNPNGTVVAPAATIIGGGGTTLNFYAPGNLIENMPFLTAAELNQRDMNQVLVGGFGTLYLSLNNMDTFRSLGGVAGGAPLPVANITGTVTAIAFGTAQVPNAAYVATDDGNIAQSFDVTQGNGNFVVTNFRSVALGAQTYNIVMDPNNPLIAYAVTNRGVFKTTNGLNWTDVTGNILNLALPGSINTLYGIEIFNNGTISTDDDSLLVGGYGGVFQLRQTPLFTAGWTRLGAALPNVVVSDLQYDASSDSLTAGTYGRGIYRIPNVTGTLLDNGITVVVTGNNSPNTMTVYNSPGTPNTFTVTDGLGAIRTFDQAIYRRIQFRGLGGADTVYIGTQNAATPGRTTGITANISVDGGNNVGDTIIIDNSADFVGRTATGTPVSIGNGGTDTLFGKGGKVSWTGMNAGAIRVQFGSGIDTYTIDDSATPIAVGYNLSATRYSRNVGGGPIDYSSVENLTVVGGAGANVYTITGTGGTISNTIRDGAGNGTMNVQGAGLRGQNTFVGAAGTDAVKLFGRATDDTVGVEIADVSGTMDGTGTLGNFRTQTVETFTFDGNGGTDNFTLSDGTNTTYGSVDDPEAGMVYLPGPNLSGQLKINRGAILPVVNFNNLTGSLSVVGDSNNSGDDDVLAVYGVSDAGLGTSIGESVGKDGEDTFEVSDALINISSSSYGVMRSINVGTTALGAPTFTSVFVRTGNEAGPRGDLVTVYPSVNLNLVVDGMGPDSVLPGDRLAVVVEGPQTREQTTDPIFGPPQTRITQVIDNAQVGAIGFESPAGTAAGLIAVATDAGGIETRVRVFEASTATLKFDFAPFPGFTGGATVASGDFNGDGIADVVAGAGPGGAPVVAVFDGLSGTLISTFFAFEPSFTGGVNVSAGDFNRDGIADIVIGTGVGGGPRIQIRDGRSLAVFRDVLVYEETFRGGVSVSTGDVTGDGVPDLTTSAGQGGGPRVVIFNGTTLAQIASFFVFDQNLRTGFNVAAGDVTGDGRADIIAGAGAGVPGQVRVFDGRNLQLISDFLINDPFDPQNNIPYIPVDVGVRVATADVNNDQIPDIVTGKGPGSSPTIRVYQIGSVNPSTNALEIGLKEIQKFEAYDAGFGQGVFVGGSV